MAQWGDLSWRPRITPTKPAAPSSPPPGTYDPSLDAALRGAKRGYFDLQQDTERDTGRAQDDYAAQIADITRQGTRGNEDLNTQQGGVERGYGRTLADILTQRNDIHRGYERQGSQQREAATSQGVSRGGTLAAALEARVGNEQHDNQPLDVAQSRAGEDRGVALSGIDTLRRRLGEDTATATSQAGLGYSRQNEDLGSQLARAGRELTNFGADTGEQKFFQAAQGGYPGPGNLTLAQLLAQIGR